ncbi:hypothetical protein [Geodermatophilus obscurus]|uniref:hypothetical protein n=1 Tax=Geodermatophilus obscurus TaxID=1861 RepID=UPI000308ECCF
MCATSSGGLDPATVGAVSPARAARGRRPHGRQPRRLETTPIAGLVAAGMDHTVAVPAVFLHRLVTFWLPILPGRAAFAWLRRSDYV